MDSKHIAIDILNYEEAAHILNLDPETIKVAVEKGDIEAKSIYDIPGYALSAWWKSIGGRDGVFLEDCLEKIPWLPAIYARAVETFSKRANARNWLFESNTALGGKSPIEYAVDNPGEVLDLLGRIEYGGIS